MTTQDIGRLAEKYGSAVYNFCLRLTNDTYSAEELYQNTFLKAIEKASSIDENNNPKAYLCTIAVSLYKSSKRKEARRFSIAPTVTLDDASQSAGDFSDEELLKKELFGEIKKAVFSLDEKIRIPVLLHYVSDMPLSDIALFLKVPEGTVKSRLHTARKKIKEKLEVYKNER